jgi:hypothetical protein
LGYTLFISNKPIVLLNELYILYRSLRQFVMFLFSITKLKLLYDCHDYFINTIKRTTVNNCEYCIRNSKLDNPLYPHLLVYNIFLLVQNWYLTLSKCKHYINIHFLQMLYRWVSYVISILSTIITNIRLHVKICLMFIKLVSFALKKRILNYIKNDCFVIRNFYSHVPNAKDCWDPFGYKWIC